MGADVSSPQVYSTFARSVLANNLKLKAGERVIIEAWPHTLPWAVALARESRRRKAFPLIHYEDEDAYWDSVDHGETKILGASPGHEWAALSETDVYIHMWGPGDRVRLNALSTKRADELFAWNAKWYEAARKAGVRGVRLEVGRPFPTLAKAYGVEEGEWRERVVAASLVDPKAMARKATPIARALRTGRRVRITHDNGTDLTLGLAGRAPRTSVGEFEPGSLKRPFGQLITLPAGAVRVALDETVADGTFVANRTDYFEDGIATGAVFEFSGGRLLKARFDRGGERFDAAYAKGGKGRDQPGLLSVGLNPLLHDTPQVEDLEAGAILVSVGGNRTFGGKNASGLFGWAIAAGARIEVDGKMLALPRAGR
jgi:leucyl aminopeptidase (aminopeptidase T)